MRTLITLVLSALLMGATAFSSIAETTAMTVDQLAAELNNDNILVVDVRSANDWYRSEIKIVGAKRMGAGQSDWILAEPKTRPIVLYCA